MNAKKGALIRTVVLIVALVNQFLTMYGKNPLPFSSEEVEYAVASLFTVGATLLAWWKNNSFTNKAVKADDYLKELKKKG